MMRDLLDITRLESGSTPPRLDRANPAELVSAAVESVRTQSEARDLELVTSLPPDLPEVTADRSQIVRVLLNLLNNAIRHTSAGQIEVSVRQDGRFVAFSVRDTGVGIPAEYLPRIFDRFVQVPGATRGGAGLGLSIARTIVHAHGGEITVESTPDAGSTFTFTLPIVAAAKPAAREAALAGQVH